MSSKYIFQVLFVITLLSQGAKAQDIDVSIDRIAQSECRPIVEDRYVGRNLLLSNYDVISYRMNWNIDPAVRYISGTVEIFFKRTDNSLQMELDLSDSLHVDEVSVHNQVLLFEHSDNTLRIHLNGNSTPGILDSIKINYYGVPANTGFGSFNQSEHAGVPIIWTLSEPYGASDWWPCKMGNEDKADSIDVSITVPNGFRAAGNGLLIDEQIIGNSTVYHWQHKYPIATYLIFLAVTNYEAYTNMVTVGNTTFPVLNYAYPEELSLWQDQSKNIVPIFDNYHQLITPYPFKDEKYGHARFGWGGGMEHQTMSSMINLDFGLMAHELAHQWFGNSITCGSWQDIWLNEGFATYMTGLSYEHLIDGIYWPAWKKQVVDHVTKLPDGSVFVSDTSDINRVFSGRLTYNKGAMVLHMLRWKIGDEKFFDGLKQYLTDQDLQYKTAKTKDFRENMESASEENLGEFFTKWIYGEGFPSYHIFWEYDDSENLHLVVGQSTSHPSVLFYPMPLPIRVYHGTDSLDLRLDNTFSGQSYDIPVGFQPDSIRFDPDRWILSNFNTIETSTATHDQYSQKVLIYPNPAKDQAQIHQLPDGNKLISIIDMQGKVVMKFESAQQSVNLKTAALSAGVYTVLIQCSNENLLGRLVLE